MPGGVISLFMLFICSLSPRTQPLSSSMHLFSFRSFHLRLVFYCSSSPARCPSLWWRVHGCGLSKTLSLLAKPERRSLQEKCEPARASQPGRSLKQDYLETALEATWWKNRVLAQVWARISQFSKVSPPPQKRRPFPSARAFFLSGAQISFFLPPPPDSWTH